MDDSGNKAHASSKPVSAAKAPVSTGTKAPIPRGIEVLLKKASVDPEFRQLLLEQRGQAAAAIELDLDPAEEAMLQTIPGEQLEQLIRQTVVPDGQRRVFLGRAAAAMLVVVGAALVLPMCVPAKTRGIQPDRLRGTPLEPDPSTNNPPPATFGVSPDRP